MAGGIGASSEIPLKQSRKQGSIPPTAVCADLQ
jgi:hypothetical protein